ncbi:DNA replication organizer [Bacillus phage vB_Bpu_PumA2]|uniref:DNA replication organizer n=1 Tax=Bacillus phage vB_Bpu_PumA2 TaxID=2662128 RepID=A0A5Q2WCV3_9CAUD|nr:GP16.7-like replication protein [Bacillus phage vB_Bpu_PumA2]QGH74245.1 DNA replication organizer [Bacillus phage vB_Bpu_PumA2]
MITLFFCAIIVLVMVIGIASSLGGREEKPVPSMATQSLHIEINRLNREIEQRKETLKNLTIDEVTQLTPIVNEALDIYDRFNIKIPKDVLEDTMYQQFDNVKQVIEYIEAQRQHWSYENRKRLPKGAYQK